VISLKIDLQVHLFEGIGLNTVLRQMETKNIDAIGLLYYKWEPKTIFSVNKMIFQTNRDYVSEQEEEYVFSFLSKDTGRKLFIILGEETSSEDFHLLSIGATNIEGSDIESLIENSLKKEAITILDHPFADIEKRYEDIDEIKEEKLLKICKDLQGKIALEWNGYCNVLARYLTRTILKKKYTHVNRKVEKLGKKMGLPVVPTTDLHIKDQWSLKKIGTSFIEIPDIDIDFSRLISSLNKNILAGNFRACKKTVGLIFFALNYGIPLLRRH
jgi:hypothetical protein